MKIVKLIIKIYRKIMKKYELSKYSPYTLAEYLRKQGAQIGKDCFINITTLGSEPYLVKIGNHVAIATGVRFITHISGWIYRNRIPDLHNFGKIVIEDNCIIGVNALILPNVTIGTNSIIGAGAVVAKDIPQNSIAVGTPAKVIGNSDDYFIKMKNTWEKQKPDGYLYNLKEGKYYTPLEFSNIKGDSNNQRVLKEHLMKIFWKNDEE